MVRTTVDFSNVEDTEFQALGSGTYRSVIDKIEKRVSQRSGEPMIVVTYKVTEGKHKSRTILDFLSLSQKALWKMKQRLAEWGVDVRKKAYSIDWEDFVGTPILVQLGEPRKLPESGIVADTITATQPVGEAEPETEEETEVEPEVKRPKKKLRATEEEEEPEEEEEAEPVRKPLKKKLRVSENEEEPEEEDEEEEAPKPRKLKVERLR